MQTVFSTFFMNPSNAVYWITAHTFPTVHGHLTTLSASWVLTAISFNEYFGINAFFKLFNSDNEYSMQA